MSYSKVIEGFGLVAGLNEKNDEVIHVGSYVYESEYGGNMGVTQFSLLDAYKDAICEERRHVKAMRRHTPDYVPQVTENFLLSFTDRVFCVEYAERNESGCYCGTQAEFEAQEKEDERLKLEAAAKEFARSRNVRLSSMEFIAAIKEEIERINDDYEQYNSHERQMEEWAAYSYAGNRSEFFNDKNFTNERYQGNINDLYDILNWLRSECPLLWAKYEEAQLAGEED